MNISILSSKEVDGVEVVFFQHSSGQGCATWSSTLPSPQPEEFVDVELDVNVAIQAGVNAFSADFEDPKIAIDDDQIILNLVVESQDEDGMTYCRLSNDCLLMIESNEEQKIEAGRKLCLKIGVRDLEMTPI